MPFKFMCDQLESVAEKPSRKTKVRSRPRSPAMKTSKREKGVGRPRTVSITYDELKEALSTGQPVKVVASQLGISRSTLKRRMSQFGLTSHYKRSGELPFSYDYLYQLVQESKSVEDVVVFIEKTYGVTRKTLENHLKRKFDTYGIKKFTKRFKRQY